MKTSTIQVISGNYIDPLNPDPSRINIEDIAHALSNVCRFTGHVREFYCVTPETKILTEDMRWVEARTLKIGDGLLSFDEFAVGDQPRKKRKLRHATVLHDGIIKRNLIRLHLSNGETITSSEEHPWLTATKQSRNQKWITAKELADGVKKGYRKYLHKFMSTWEHLETYETGYLSGIFDGEGHICAPHVSGSVSLGFAQNKGLVLDKSLSILNKFHNNNSVRENSSSKVMNVVLRGSILEKLEFLGKVRPVRLLDKLTSNLKSGIFHPELEGSELLEVVDAEYLGEGEVVALETSTHTYFANGFAAHNSVAQHSVLVSYVVPKELALAGLMHDASEAYLADIASPVKPHFTNYYKIEDALMTVIAEKFGFEWPMHPEVRKADLILLATEKRDLLPKHEEDEQFWMFDGWPALDAPIYPYEPKAAKAYFLNRFNELTEGTTNPSRTMLVGTPDERC